MKILPIQPSDIEEVLALNRASVPHVNLISHDELRWFTDNAAYLQVAKIDEELAGFLVGLRPGIVSSLIEAGADVDGLRAAINLDAAFALLQPDPEPMPANETDTNESASPSVETGPTTEDQR